MDTLIADTKKNSKLIVTALNVSIIFGMLISQHVLQIKPIFADDQITIANSAIVAPILQGTNLGKDITDKLSAEQKIQNFDAQIKRKYKKGVVFDVDKGVKRIKITRTYQGRPVQINVIEADTALNPELKLSPAVASTTLAHKATITSFAKKNNSIVAINGTYFKQDSGVPLGTMMIDKKIITGPIYDRVAMGIFDNHYDMARIQLKATLKTWCDSIKVDNINQPRMLATYTIAYTPEWGKTAPPSPKYGMQVAVSNNKVSEISTSALKIPQDGYVVVGPAKNLDKLKLGENINFDVATIPNWENVNHIISGGPYLVKDNQIYIDAAAQKLGSIGGRNPRTAVGYTADNHIIIVTVDGREKSSVGMTLTELANFMKSIGCYNAMNLDGGGSTVLYVNGKVVNHPQFKGGIALSNALTLNKI